MEKKELSGTVGENVDWWTTTENSVQVSQKSKNRIII